MNSYEMSTQNIHNVHVYSSDEIESKRINTEESKFHVYYKDRSESKMIIFNACSLDKIKAKSVHRSVNTSKLKDTKE